MKILIVLNGYFPGKRYGGPPVSINNFCTLLANHDCYIVTKNHDYGESMRYDGIHSGWNDRENCRVNYLDDEDFTLKELDRITESIQPDLIYLQSIFEKCVYYCLRIAKYKGIKVLLAPRGELCEGAIRIRKWKKMPYISYLCITGLVKNIHFQSTSEEESLAIKKYLLAKEEQIHALENIPSMPKAEISRKQKNPGEGSFVFLSRIHPKKNLLFAIRCFKHTIGCVKFDIYGPIEDEDYWKQCQHEIKFLPENVNVEYRGLVDHDMVHEVFCRYDAFLFPTLSENYGHVIAESIIVGTPVIISDQTPWNDINDYKAGWAIKLDDSIGFENAISTVIEMTNQEHIEMTSRLKNYWSSKSNISVIRAHYENVLQSIVGLNQ